MVTVEKKDLYGEKDCLVISDGKTQIALATDRVAIVGYGFCGGKNILDADGHKVGFAPQTEKSKSAGEMGGASYEILENGVIVRGVTNTETNLAFGLKVEMDEDGAILIDHQIKNNGIFDLKLALTAQTSLIYGGLLTTPQSNWDNGFGANKFVALWKNSKMNDKRVFWGENYITLSQDKSLGAFRFAQANHRGWMAYFANHSLFIKEFPYVQEQNYPDFNCNFEVITDGAYICAKSLTPIIVIPSGESREYSEVWHLYENIDCPKENDEVEIDSRLKVFTDIYDPDEEHFCGCECDCCDEDEDEGCFICGCGCGE